MGRIFSSPGSGKGGMGWNTGREELRYSFPYPPAPFAGYIQEETRGASYPGFPEVPSGLICDGPAQEFHLHRMNQ